MLCYNTLVLNRTSTLRDQFPFITADKILISIHRTAKTIWVIKTIRIAGTISTKQNCLRCKSLQRVGIIPKARKALYFKGFRDFETSKNEIWREFDANLLKDAKFRSKIALLKTKQRQRTHSRFFLLWVLNFYDIMSSINLNLRRW